MDDPKDMIRGPSPVDFALESKSNVLASLKNLLKGRVTRRDVLKAGGLTGLSLSALWALACQQAAPTATPTKPAAAAPTPTTAPAATTAPGAPTSTKAPAASPTAEKIGRQLIGKLEGPEVITDVAKYPKAFKEAPMLADLVKAGKLPAVKDRLPEEPLVVKPVHAIGKYGGIWRRPFTGPADAFAGVRASGGDHHLYMDYTGQKVVPNIARGWEITDGGRTFNLFLRKGMKWSDGQPFTADDYVFWYEDMYMNTDLKVAKSPLMNINYKPGTMVKVDAYTVSYKFPDPYYGFAYVMAIGQILTGTPINGVNGVGGFAPAHYLKQFHPKYAAAADLDAKLKEAKFDNWVLLLKNKNCWFQNTELPVVTAWKTTTPNNTPVWTLERNPYSIWVDTEGNQLPYLDKIVMTLGENLEIVNLRAVAGEYDMNARHMDIGKIPVFLANQEKGGYKLSINPMETGSDYGIWFNMHYEEDPELGKWYGTTDFRRALAIAIDRDQINETFFLGIGIPGSAVVAETNKYCPGPEYRKLWATLDVKKANEMLDKIGLDKKDSEGYRLRTDGKGRLIITVNTLGGQFVQYTQISEMVRQQWKNVGIDLRVVEVERSLHITNAGANKAQLFTWSNDGTDYMFVSPSWCFPTDGAHWVMPLYGKWVATAGKEGKTPPPRMKELYDMWVKGFGVPEEESVKLGKEIWKIALDEAWYVGVAGQCGAVEGVQLAKVNMGNVPARFANYNQTWPPSISRPQTFYWKS